MLPGCGKVTAERLVGYFGVRLFDVFNSPDAERELMRCPKIGAKTAEKLKRNWDEGKGSREASAFLEEHGWAVQVQVDLMKSTLKAPGTKRLKLKYDGPLSFFAFEFNLRCYTTGTAAAFAPRSARAPSTSASGRRSRQAGAYTRPFFSST